MFRYRGTFSYTVTVGTTKIFQFRVHDSSFDMQAVSLAKPVHPQFVPSCKYHGTLGQSRPLHIYKMENLPATAYIIARNIFTTRPPDAVSQQRNTMEDLARYVYTIYSWLRFKQELRICAVSSRSHGIAADD